MLEQAWPGLLGGAEVEILHRQGATRRIGGGDGAAGSRRGVGIDGGRRFDVAAAMRDFKGHAGKGEVVAVVVKGGDDGILTGDRACAAHSTLRLSAL